MTKILSALAAKGMIAIQVALLAIAAVMILVPQARTDLPHLLFWVPFFLEGGSYTFRVWRAGLLRSTPHEIFTSFQAGAPRISTGTLERLATGVGMIAALVLALA